MQLLMRRPEISGFISVAPPANAYDFTFLAPCPSSGLIVHGDVDDIVPRADVKKLVDRLSSQRGITIDFRTIRSANHVFQDCIPELVEQVETTLESALDRETNGRENGRERGGRDVVNQAVPRALKKKKK